MWICSNTMSQNPVFINMKIYVNSWAAALYSKSKPLPAWKKYPDKTKKQQSRTV